MYENRNQGLLLIPKYEKYMEYMLEIILIRLPRTEKYSIGTEELKFLTAMATIQFLTPTSTSVSASCSNTIRDYVFYGMHTVEVLVLKGFIPS